MTTFDDRLRGLAGAMCERCDKDGCALRDIPKDEWFVLDVDRLAEQGGGRSCDCLLISRRSPRRALIVELKSGRSDARRATEQLQACATRVQALLDGQPVATFRAVLVTGRVNSSAELKVLGRARVKFRGRAFPLTHKRCGSTLAALVPTADAPSSRA